MAHFQTRKGKSTIYPKVRFNLKLKMITLISLLIIGIFVIFGLFLRSFIHNTLEDQIGERALRVAQSVANIPELQSAFVLENPASVIQEIVTPIQQETGAEFIVVGNKEGVRYAHPNENRIGKKMVGGDNDRALLAGDSYISKRVGSLGLSIRGKVPIYNAEQEIIGVVSVGFLNDDVQGIIKSQSRSLWFTFFGIILLGMVGAVLISHYIKNILSNLEPEEISHLLVEKEAILQSTHEGVIAVNQTGLITMINSAAQRILFKEVLAADHLIGKSILEILPYTDIFDVLESGETHYHREMVLEEEIVLVNRTPIYLEQKIVGAVSTIRKKTEIEEITNELLEIKQYANAQRAQTHEFSNKLYIILGLLQLDQIDEAIDFIQKESNIQQEWSRFLLENVADPMVHGLLQGKYNQANEAGINMFIQPDSQLTYRLSSKKTDILLTVLGNLIENAIEEVKEMPEGRREIAILFTDMGNEVMFEVDDAGRGISKKDEADLFVQGFSTKEGHHRGTGLSLSNHLLSQIGGNLLVEEGDLGGACFVMIIPKEERE